MLHSSSRGFRVSKADSFRLIETILIAFAGGEVFTLMHFPLAWMLGPLTAVLFWQVMTKRKLYWPVGCRNGGQLLLGYSMGLSFTAQSARQIVAQLPSMFFSTVLMIGFGLAVAYFMARYTDINLPSSVMGTTPGGLSQMVLLSEEIKGAEPTIVTFMQTIRMLTVVFMVPSLAIHGLAGSVSGNSIPTGVYGGGSSAVFSMPSVLIVAPTVLLVAVLAAKYRFPTPWILGPLITSAVFTVTGWVPPHLPQELIIAAQCSLGIYLGLGIKFNTLGNWRRLLPFSLAAGISIVAFALVIAYVLSLIYPMNLVTAFLSIAPGGLPEMGVTAHMVNADVSMVAAYQLFRVFFILFIVPLILRRIFGKDDQSFQHASKKVTSSIR